MYNVILVDDEPVIREGLRKIVKWEDYNCSVCCEADDGIDGIKLIKEYKPEIIFTDIKMSEVSGLEMISSIKETVPESKIIILTGYRDFNYAKEAVKLGAFDFILKPSKIKEIENVLSRAVKELDVIKNKQTEISILKNSLERYKENLIKSVAAGDKSRVLKPIQNIKRESQQMSDKIDKSFYTDVIKILYEIREYMLKTECNNISDDYMENVFKLITNCNDVNDLNDLIEEFSFHTCQKVNEYNNKMDLKVTKAIEYICEHYSDKLTLNIVAEHLYVSSSYLSRIFTKNLGLSFIDYLNKFRIEKAKEFLGNVQYKAYEVADLVGINDAQYFSKLFKKIAGVTPTEYRNAQGID